MASREELLSSIKPDMRLTKNFFMRIYGYELTWPGFADQALDELEKAGCSSARTYYQKFVGEYEEKHEEEMKRVALWYRGYSEKKGDEGLRKKEQETEPINKKHLQNLSNKDLLQFLENLAKGA